jgi:ribosomal protein S14
MLLSANKDKKLRKTLRINEIRQKQYKYLKTFVLNNKQLNSTTKTQFFSVLDFQKSRVASKTKLINRCLMTYKARVMYKQFKINRMKLKDMLQLGIVPGYKKAAW